MLTGPESYRSLDLVRSLVEQKQEYLVGPRRGDLIRICIFCHQAFKDSDQLDASSPDFVWSQVALDLASVKMFASLNL